MTGRFILILAAVFLMVSTMGCDRRIVGGAAAGALGTGAAYEYQSKKAMDELEEDRRAGRISEEEFQRRKKDIEKRSLIQ